MEFHRPLADHSTNSGSEQNTQSLGFEDWDGQDDAHGVCDEEGENQTGGDMENEPHGLAGSWLPESENISDGGTRKTDRSISGAPLICPCMIFGLRLWQILLEKQRSKFVHDAVYLTVIYQVYHRHERKKWFLFIFHSF